MLIEIQEDVNVLSQRLAERGYACRVKEVGRGNGVTIFIRPQGPSQQPSAEELRAACLDVFRDREHRRVGRDGELRIRLRDVARRLGRQERAVGRACDAAGLTIQKMSGRTWIVHDEQWNRARRTPVLA